MKVQKTNNTFEELLNIIKSHENIVVVGHSNPDGDAIGSITGLVLGLNDIGIYPKVVLDKFSGYDTIPYDKVLYTGNTENIECDLFISLDCGDMKRFEYVDHLYKNAKTTINIDHHASNDYFADYNYVDVNSSSTSEIIYMFVTTFTKVTKDMAKALYTGIVYDTAGFMHSCTTRNTMNVAGELIDTGIDFNCIYKKMMHEHTILQSKILCIAIENMKVLNDGKLVYSTITLDELDKIGADTTMIGFVVNYLSDTKDCELAMFVYEKEPNVCKVSMRSKYVDVNAIANVFGGGGHVRASGCTIDDNILNVVQIMTDKLVSELNKNEK